MKKKGGYDIWDEPLNGGMDIELSDIVTIPMDGG